MKKIYRLLDEIIALNVQVDYSRHDTMLTVSQSEEKREQLQIALVKAEDKFDKVLWKLHRDAKSWRALKHAVKKAKP